MPEPTETPDHPALPLPPPALFAIAVVLGFVLDPVPGPRFLDREALWQVSLGFGLAVAALGLAVWAFGEFRRARTNVDPRKPATQVVTTGPYGLMRNPMYVGFVLLQAGASLVLSLEWGLVLVPALWLALHHIVVRREERYLGAKFGELYRNYTARVRRWGVF